MLKLQEHAATIASCTASIKKLTDELHTAGLTDSQIAQLLPQMGSDYQIDMLVKDIAGLLHRKVLFLHKKSQSLHHKNTIKIDKKLSTNATSINKKLEAWRVLQATSSEPYKLTKVPSSAADLTGLGSLRLLVDIPGAAPSTVGAATRAVRLSVVYRDREAQAARTQIQMLLRELRYVTTYFEWDRVLHLGEAARVVYDHMGE